MVFLLLLKGLENAVFFGVLGDVLARRSIDLFQRLCEFILQLEVKMETEFRAGDERILDLPNFPTNTWFLLFRRFFKTIFWPY